MIKSETKKYSNILLKGSFIVTISEASTKLITLLLLPVFSHYLSPTDFGTVSMVTMVISALSLIYNPGLTSATTRLYHDTDSLEDRQILIGSAHQFYLYFPMIFTVIFLVVGPFIFDKIFNNFSFFPYGMLAIILAFFSQTKNIWVTMMMLQYRVTQTAIYTLISVGLGIIVSLLLVIVIPMGALGKVIGMFPQVLFIFLIAYFSTKNYTAGKWSFESLKKQLIFGLPIIGSIWSTSLLQVVDRYIIERMAGLNSVGLYSFAFQIAQIPLFLVIGIRKVWNPIFYENMNKQSFHVISKLIYLYNVILSMTCITIILFSKEFIHLFIDSRYYGSIPLISILVIGVYFSGLLLIPNSALTFDKKFAITSKIAFFAIIVDAIINIVLIPYFDVMGSAIAAAIAYFIYFLLGYIYSRKITENYSNFKNLIVPPLLVGGATSLTFLFDVQLSALEIVIKIIYVMIVLGMLLYIGDVKLIDIRKLLLGK